MNLQFIVPDSRGITCPYRKLDPDVVMVEFIEHRPLSFPKIISGYIDDVARPGSEWLQWRQTVGWLDVTAHLSVMPSAYGLDCNTLHRRKEYGVGACPYGQKIETAAGIEAVAKAPEFGRRVAERIFGCHSLNATRRQGPRGNA